MRLAPIVIVGVLATTLSMSHALAFTIGDNSPGPDGSSRIADPDEQLNVLGWQAGSEDNGGDRNSAAPNLNQTPNAPNQNFLLPNLFAPFTPPHR
jgi:hypothetical protein